MGVCVAMQLLSPSSNCVFCPADIGCPHVARLALQCIRHWHVQHTSEGVGVRAKYPQPVGQEYIHGDIAWLAMNMFRIRHRVVHHASES
jgi:hypothetical protein